MGRAWPRHVAAGVCASALTAVKGHPPVLQREQQLLARGRQPDRAASACIQCGCCNVGAHGAGAAGWRAAGRAQAHQQLGCGHVRGRHWAHRGAAAGAAAGARSLACGPLLLAPAAPCSQLTAASLCQDQGHASEGEQRLRSTERVELQLPQNGAASSHPGVAWGWCDASPFAAAASGCAASPMQGPAAARNRDLQQQRDP